MRDTDHLKSPCVADWRAGSVVPGRVQARHRQDRPCRDRFEGMVTPLRDHPGPVWRALSDADRHTVAAAFTETARAERATALAGHCAP